MKNNRLLMLYVIYFLLGATLLALGCAEVVDAFWSGMGSALIVVGILRFIRAYRFHKDATCLVADERNRFLRNKAWAWAGYLFIIIAGCIVIVSKAMGQDTFALAASYAVCLMLVLYWGSYAILKKKY